MPFVALVGLGAGRPPNVPFVVHPIDNGASETASVFDVDGDRRLDIVSGDFWYQAPAWTPHRFREMPFTSNYVDAFSDFPLDVDGDGRTDLVTVSWFAKRIAWYRNPGKTDAHVGRRHGRQRLFGRVRDPRRPRQRWQGA